MLGVRGLVKHRFGCICEIILMWVAPPHGVGPEMNQTGKGESHLTCQDVNKQPHAPAAMPSEWWNIASNCKLK